MPAARFGSRRSSLSQVHWTWSRAFRAPLLLTHQDFRNSINATCIMALA